MMLPPVYKRTGKLWGHLSRVLLLDPTTTTRVAEVILPSGRIERVSWSYLDLHGDGYRLKVGAGELALFPTGTASLMLDVVVPERTTASSP